jgi:hypothetical protein
MLDVINDGDIDAAISWYRSMNVDKRNVRIYLRHRVF